MVNMSTAVMPSSVYDFRDLVKEEGQPEQGEAKSWTEDSGLSFTSISLATLLGDLMTNTHRRLDRSHSEPSKSLINVNTSRYKTELCRPYEENGMCKYGDKCQFAHGEAELRGLVRHPKYKTELCRTFHTVGFCPYGPRCHFIHNAEEARGCCGGGQAAAPPAKARPPRPLSLSPPPGYSPPPPPVSPDSRLPVFNRISAPTTTLLSYSLRLNELLA